ncbi:MFS transporter, PAT family, beta-lactamase induction signal transducer AmpG [Saccharicrinis carchari]|uniref:MFS transporter, PAT family, beta-lactamase induction signal transducer AmpG n=1 Tax=Saccharicrinis carchari TaxID=1168039 RepID=A0A521B449_SACCC|nr:AmpG family muropeptide MFS transporter [Saccharicrinis carchari]SMO41888.1 MFS transporter, PAT family, beta-lactamase induction signal transducer AmpG [Saccharicrinis carchari]
MNKLKSTSPWAWVPTLYFAQGIPYVVVMTVSVIMYKRLGVSNTDIALYTSWLYLPWVIKPLWSPVVDLLKTKRWWIIIMQLLIGAGLAGVALTIPVPNFFKFTLAFLWLLAFSSATHDIAADGFYMLGLNEHKQAYFIGIRSTFYRISMITGQGLLIILAGFIESSSGLEPVDFTVTTQSHKTEWLVPTDIDYGSAQNGEMSFVIDTDQVALGTNNINKTRADEIKAWAKAHNLNNGFVQQEATLAKDDSWWARQVADPLKKTLKEKFGKADKVVNQADAQGNIAVIGIRLSTSPGEGETVVLNMDRNKGAKDLSLIEGQRLTFTADNWNKNAQVLIQVDPKQQGVVSTSFRGLSGNIPLAWSVTFFVLAGLFVTFLIYHRFILPKPAGDRPVSQGSSMFKEFGQTFVSFFKKDNIGMAMLFILVFRLGESQLVKLASPFLLDAKEIGGLGLTTGDVGLIYGTIGILFLTLGGILGGWVASRQGLKYWIFWMTLAINLPNLTYVYLSFYMPESMWLIASSVAVEQFGYGFGFTAFMLYLIYFSQGKSKTAHYAICTGFMALGMMIPGMVSGWLQEIIGYQNFFIWVMICTIPSFVVIKFLKIDPTFGIKKAEE